MARNEGEGSAFILGLKTGDFPLCPLPSRKLNGRRLTNNMPLARIDNRGRIQLPSLLRQKMELKKGDEFVAEDLGEDTIILKKVNLRELLKDAIENAKSVDLDGLEREIEEESNQLARQKFKVSTR